MKEVKAVAKNVRSTSRKARKPANAVRGMKATYALDVLKYMPKKAAHDVRKVVASAIANAVNNEGMDADKLTIAKIFVDEAFTLKRFRAESRGRARRILKRNCHITVYLTDGTEVEATDKKSKSKSEKKSDVSVKSDKKEDKSEKKVNSKKSEKKPTKTAAKKKATVKTDTKKKTTKTTSKSKKD